MCALNVQSDEVCLEQGEYEKSLKNLELFIQPKISFEDNVYKLEFITIIRSKLKPDQVELLDFIDTISNDLFFILLNSLPFVGKEEFDERFQQRVFNLISKIKESRGLLPSTLDNTELVNLSKNIGITNEVSRTARKTASPGRSKLLRLAKRYGSHGIERMLNLEMKWLNGAMGRQPGEKIPKEDEIFLPNGIITLSGPPTNQPNLLMIQVQVSMEIIFTKSVPDRMSTNHSR